MKILFLYGGAILPKRGGVQRVTAVLADAFASRGNGVFYLSLPQNKSPEADSGRQFYLPETCWDASQNRTSFRTFLRDNQIDIVINQGGCDRNCSHLAYSAKDVGVPVISVCHLGLTDSAKNYRAIHEAKWKKHGFGWFIPLTDWTPIKKCLLLFYKKKYQTHYHELCLKSDKVVLLSEKFKSELAFYFDEKTCPRNIVVIPNPCSFPPPNPPRDFTEKSKELLFCGRIDFSQKRVDLLLRIWKRLFRTFPDWKLTIVGGGCALEATQAMTQKLGLERISFEGFQDPVDYYKRAAIFCMTSAWETFGLVLVEAMNFACVPVAFNSYAAVEDIINDGKNGFLIPPMNCKKYVERLSLLMSNEALRKYLSNEAAKKALGFSVNRITDKWMALLKTTVEKSEIIRNAV